MSVALRRPTVCLFGPVDPAHYGFHEEDFVETIYHPVYCSPCVHEADEPPCAGNNICMQKIQVDEVFAAVQRRLAGVPAAARGGPQVDYTDQYSKPLGMVLSRALRSDV